MAKVVTSTAGNHTVAADSIGARARTIRKRRGLSIETAAGLAGISKGYLSKLENGKKAFDRRGLIENLATALSCSVADLTGQPYLPGDRASAEALATLPGISVALYDATLNDVPDMPVRSVAELARWAAQANEYCANSQLGSAGRHLGELLTELHVHVVSGDADSRREALSGLIEACFAASSTARTLGNLDLAVHAARRAEDAAALLGRPAFAAFAAMTSTSALSRLGARHRATQVAATALASVDDADPTDADTAVAESAGMLHLTSAQMAAKDGRSADVTAHLDAARDLAAHTGERNTLMFSFGPANVRAWTMSTAVELGDGPAAAERIERDPAFASGLTTADRRAALHFDLARGYAQAGGDRDGPALRHLDTADRIAPQRIRHDPVARELVALLDRRARSRIWELDSLKNRFGVMPA